jgi:hypothetical protein
LFFIVSLFIIFIVVVIIIVAVPSPRIFHSKRRKSRIDCGLRLCKTHGSAPFMPTLLQVRKPLTYLLMRLSDEGIIGIAHIDEGLEALENDVLFLTLMSSSSRGLRSRGGRMPTSRGITCTAGATTVALA